MHALEVQSILYYFDPFKAPALAAALTLLSDGGAEDKSSTPYIFNILSSMIFISLTKYRSRYSSILVECDIHLSIENRMFSFGSKRRLLL